MASEIHKKRTGKGFRISEEIVLKEEMYEEEDDDLPRSYRLLGGRMQTSSARMNNKLENFVSNKLTMTSLLAKTNDDWRENEINKLFEQSFGKITSAMQRPQQQQPQQPNPDILAQQQHAFFLQQQQALHQHPMTPMSTEQPEMMASPISPHQQMPMDFSSPQQHMHPAMSQAHQLPGQFVMDAHPQGHPRGHSVSGIPPAFPGYAPMPQRHNSETPHIEHFAQFNDRMQSDSPIDLAPGQHSAFSHDMPPEMRLMMEQAAVDPEMNAHLQEWMMANAINAGHAVSPPSKLDFYSASDSPMAMHHGMLPVDMPTMPVDDLWKSFIDDAVWGTEPQEVQQ